MITITRRQVRHQRRVFRRSVLGIGNRGPVPPLVFLAEGTQLRVQHRYKFLALELIEPGAYEPQDAIALPLDVLNEIEGSDKSPVVLKAGSPTLTTVRFHDHGIPQVREYPVPDREALAAFPNPPSSWSTNAPEILSALAEATKSTCTDSTRYALNCIQLKGETGEIGATDGRQLLLQSGFRFPWPGNVLVYRAPVLCSRDLPHDQPIAVGRTDTHVALQFGAWTLFLEIYAEGRFPILGDIIPDPHVATARLQLDPEDARFLGSALGRLPGAEETYAPSTLDLNGQVVVRAKGSDQTQTTELVLSRSGYTGAAMRINTQRQFLGRALHLGFREIEFTSDKTPLVCRDANRIYAWQPLDHESALAPSDDALRIESASAPTCASPLPPSTSQGEPSVKAPTTPTAPSPSTASTPTNGHPAPETVGPGGLIALIQDAEALHQALTDARARAGRLIAALRRHRKQARLMASTIAALKELRFQEVAE